MSVEVNEVSDLVKLMTNNGWKITNHTKFLTIETYVFEKEGLTITIMETLTDNET